MNANLSILYDEKGKPRYWASRMFSWASEFSQHKHYTSVITAHTIPLQIFSLLWCFFIQGCATFCGWAAITFGLEGNLLAQLCQLELSIWIGSTRGVVSSDGFFYPLMPPTNLPLPPLLTRWISFFIQRHLCIHLPHRRCRGAVFCFLLIKFLSILLHQL